MKDLIGKKFERWTVIAEAPTRKHYRKMVLCKCDCGSVGEVPIHKLGKWSKSCGCLKIELQTKHGSAKRGSESDVYRIWASMKDRCQNPKNKRYYNYGGRGITLCDRWQTFENFASDMGPRPKGLSVDRINNDKGYEPGNCRWATASQQMYNRRRPSLEIRKLQERIKELEEALKAKGVNID